MSAARVIRAWDRARRASRVLAVALLGSDAAALAETPAEASAGRAGPAGEAEVLLGARADRDAVVITVVSNGCTGRADFGFRVEEAEAGPAVTFLRAGRDACKAMPHAEDIAFTLEELGVPPGRPVAILNRFGGGLLRP